MSAFYHRHDKRGFNLELAVFFFNGINGSADPLEDFRHNAFTAMGAIG